MRIAIDDKMEHSVEAYANLASDLSAAICRFLESQEPRLRRFHRSEPELGAAAKIERPAWESQRDKLMSLVDVRHELGLTERQITSLRRLWGFPEPWQDGERTVFLRADVDAWVRKQPNQANLAAVLQLRRRG